MHFASQIFRFVLILIVFVNVGMPTNAENAKPNFIVIFTDDQGYNDLGCFGSASIRTPNIDRLAAEGMRFTSYYSGASVCTPSRAALLTGCYPERVGNLPVLFPNSDRGLSHEETTIAEMLKQVGYATSCIGKWHLGHHPEFLPTNHGFDEYFGIPYSNDMGIDPSMKLASDVLFREGQDRNAFQHSSPKLPPLMQNDEVIEWPADQTTLTKRYTERAVRFIEDHKDTPFFIYMPHTMPHIPLYASDEFRGQSDIGLYGDTIEEIDWSVGKIMEALDRLGISNNTLVLYTSDNGPWNLPGNKTDKVKGNMNRRIGGSAEPLRGYKFSKWEGGMRVPAVVRFPAKIQSGQVCNEIVSSIDVLPTLAELSHAELPDNKIDGESLVGLISGAESTSPRDTFFYRTNGVRFGNWKLIDGKLFDLPNDISEEHDLKAENPEVFAQLSELLADHKLQIREEARRAAYHKRDPFTLPGHEGWTVMSGRWSVSNKGTLRQQSDFVQASLRSGEIEALGKLSLECKQAGRQGNYGIKLRGQNSEFSVAFFNDGRVKIQSGNSRLEATVKSFNIASWHQIEIRFDKDLLKVFVNDDYVGGLPARSGAYSVDLLANEVKCEFRDLQLFSANGKSFDDTLSTATQKSR